MIHTSTSPPPPRRFRLGLRGKLLLATLALVNVAFVVVWWIAADTSEQGLRSLTETNLDLGAQSLADAISRTLSDTHADAATMSRLDLPAEAIESGDPKSAVWYANEVMRSKGNYAAIVLADASGRVVAANTVDRRGQALSASILGRQISDAGWKSAAARALSGRTGAWVAPMHADTLGGVLASGDSVAGWTFPVLDIVDEPLGTLTVFLSMDAAAESLAGYTMIDRGRIDSAAVVADAHGHPVVLAAGVREREPGWGSAIVPRPRDPQRAFEWSSPGGAALFIAERSITGVGVASGWRMVVMKSAAALEAPVRSLSLKILIAFSIAVLAVTLLMIGVATRFVGPIRRLTQATLDTTRASDYQDIPVEGTDEVAILTGSFNRMLATLKGYQIGLEDQVSERTSQLEQARREVKDILDHIAQAIITVGRDGRVNAEFSAHTTRIFGDVPIAGVPALSLLQISPETCGENHSRMAFWINNIHGADELQWLLAEGEALRAHTIVRPGGDAVHIELEYVPIYQDRALTKLMIIGKDVTDLRALEQEVIRKGKENEDNVTRISEIAGLDPELFETFLRESAATVDACLQAADELEADRAARDSIHRLFRGMHTLKGNARIFKISTIQDAAHEAEALLQAIRDSGEPVTDATLAGIRAHVVRVRDSLDGLEELGNRLRPEIAHGQEVSADDCLEAAHRLRDTCQHYLRALSRDRHATPSVALVGALHRVRSMVDNARLADLAQALADLDSAVAAPDRAQFAERLLGFGAVIERTESVRGELRACPDADRFQTESSELVARIRDHLASWRCTGAPDTLDQALSSARALASSARDQKIYTVSEASQSVEIAMSRLREQGGDARSREASAPLPDQQLRCLEHLIQSCAALVGWTGGKRNTRRQAAMKVQRGKVVELRKAYQQLATAVDGANGTVPEVVRNSVLGIGSAVQGLTMVPVTDLFDRCRKLVFDLAIELGKRVHDVSITCDGVQVDERILGRLRDVLLHALRNAIDHGIELPDERAREGKPPAGAISVDCRAHDDQIVFSISDDGRGVDFGAIRRRALENRLLTEDEIDRARHSQLLPLLFLPGFSTARRVTEVSGRGVGMDVIRTAMQELSGTADIQSVAGRGTVLTLTVPLSYHERL